MHRRPLLHTLEEYEALCNTTLAAFPDVALERFRAFIASTPRCFERENQEGHLTASALVLSPDRSKVLLTFHAKLKKWLQLGGHADGHTLLHEVALREAQEESGSHALSLVQIVPFDLDIHLIPERKDIPAHLHYDARYIVQCSDEKSIALSEESLDLQWIALEKVKEYTFEPSVLRQINKLRSLL